LLDFIRNSLEWKNFGWNFLTTSFVITVILGTFQLWGLWKQHKTIKEKLSGKCVPVLLFSYGGCLLLSFLYYGFLIKSLAVIFLWPRILLIVVLLYDLFKFEGFSTRQKLLSISFCGIIVSTIVFPRKDIVLMFGMIGGLFPAIQQPVEMWRKRSRGSADIHYLITNLTSSLFWVIYWFAVKSAALAFLNLIGVLILSITAILWFKYK